MKRLSDIILALVLAALFLPVIAATAIMVLVSLGNPILFTQRRAGCGGREFSLFKWRSMTDERDASGELLPDDARITVVGRFIRRTRVDELPSVLNILRGDLSFVGPRPLPASTSINQAFDRARLAVRPGLTGLAQVSGNTLLSDREKLAIDLYYIGNNGPIGDFVIIWHTIVTVVLGERRDEAIVRRATDEMEERS